MRLLIGLFLFLSLLIPAAAAATGPRLQHIGEQAVAGNASYPSAYRAWLSTELALAGHPRTMVGTLTDPQGQRHDGHAGWNIAGLTSQVESWLAAATPDEVVLLTGTNDILTNVPPATAAARLATLLDAVQARVPASGIYLCTIPPANRPPALQANITAYNASVASLAAARGLHLVDVYSAVTPATDLAADGATLNGYGEISVGTAIKSALLAG